MSTGFAPPTIPSVETGTPPREWSESVLASRGPVEDTPATFSETSARTYDPETTAQKSQEESQALKTLKRQQASYSLSSKDREGPHVSLPSTELKGAQPLEHTDGVGALPGNLSESSVALLPDERQQRTEELRPVSPRQRRDTIKPSAAAGDDETQTRESMETKIPRDTMLSKSEPVASRLSNVPLQGTQAEVGEAGQSDVAATGPQVYSQEKTSEIQSQEVLGEQRRADVVSATAQDPETKDVEGSDIVSKPHQGQSALQDVQGGEEEQKHQSAERVREGYGGDYHPAELHPPPPGASAAEYESPVVTRSEVEDAPTTHQATEGTEKKPGFMTIVKGEMKILAGKVRGDEHKVAEGKRLVHGEA